MPVGESLAYGKICLGSATGGIPEVGGKLVDYIDPYNPSDGLERLLRYLDDPELRRSREREIADHFEPRSWRGVAEDLLSSTQVLARQARQFEGVAAITLPPNRYLSISSDASSISMDGMDGALSAELICISGWHSPEVSGVRAAQPATMIRFRADAAVGTRINLLIRLAALGRDFRIRIRSGSGAESEVFLADGAEGMAVLSCEIEPEKLVTAYLSLGGAALDGNEDGVADWMLRGVLYFDPKCVAAEALNKYGGHRTAIALPPNQYLSIGSGAPSTSTDGMDGTPSAELICISGWHSPEVAGVRAAQPATMIRFRADAEPGTRINLLMRLAALDRDFRIRIRSGSGAQTEVFLADGSEGMAALSCEVEPERLVTAYLSLVGEALDGNGSSAAEWMLRGVLYFDPKCAAGEVLNKFNGVRGAQAPIAVAPVSFEPLDRPDAHTTPRSCLAPPRPADGR